jgi:hypothetical protein
MINKLCIPKNSLVVIACALCHSLTSQIPYSYNPAPTNFSGNYSSGTQNNYSYNATLNTVNASSAATYDIKASKSIGILPGSSAANFSSGSFAAHIDPPPFEVVSYHSGGFNNIPLYDKFELGLKLPLSVTQKVDDFFGEYIKGGHNGYGCNFNTANGNINPYDPDQISVEATFSFPGKPSQTIYGFYYREYSYSTGDPQVTTPKYATTNWVEDLNLQYHWRVRFAPKYIGTYNVTWVIKGANNAILYQDNVGQNFSTISSNSLGFIKLGQNNKFFVTQPDPSQPEKTILPVGVCAASPIAALNTTRDPIDGLPSTDCVDWGCNDYNSSYPSRYWRHRETIKNRIAMQGGNFARVYSTYYAYSFEWEHAGIYDAWKDRPLQTGLTYADVINDPPYSPAHYKGVNRQAIMWEFDRLLDMAKDNNIYIQWATEIMDNGFIAGTNGSWITQNPYAKPGSNIITSPNSNSVVQFFTDADAKKAYKKRLRYMIARYGYSTNIADFELFNEFHLLHEPAQGNVSSLDNSFKPWLEDMLDYIKNPNKLNHKDHLFTASYELGYTGDQVGNATDLDFFATHPYTYNEDPSFKKAFYNTQTFRQMYTSANGKPKPCQAGELGLQAAWECVTGPAFPEYMGPTFHTLLWSTTFIGGLTSGLDNWSGGLDIDPATQMTHGCGDGFVQHFKPLQAFIKDINFDQGNYVPKYHIQQNGTPVETFYLIDNNGFQADHIVGYIRNRTFWWENFTNTSSGMPYYNSNYPNQLKNEYLELYNYNHLRPDEQAHCPNNPTLPVSLPSAVPVISGNSGALHIYGLKQNASYTIDWYDTYNIDPALQNPLLVSVNVSINGSGPLVVTPPPFSGCHNQEYGFKIYPLGQARYASSNNPVKVTDETNKKNNSNSFLSIAETEMQVAADDIKIYPNPASDKLFIKYDAEIFKDATLALYDLSGRLIFKQNSTKELSTANLENGAYMVKFSSDNFVRTFKINVMH